MTGGDSLADPDGGVPPEASQYKRLPASPHSKQEFADGAVEVTAKFAHYDESRTPHRLYVFSPAKISVAGEAITLPKDHEGERARTQAYTIQCHSEDHFPVDLIIYYLHQMGGTALADAYRPDDWTDDSIPWDDLTPLVHWLTMLELHELTHWAVTPADNDHEIDHWVRWNTTLRSVVDAVSDTDISWNWAEYEVRETENGVQLPVGIVLDQEVPLPGDSQPEQAALSDFKPDSASRS